MNAKLTIAALASILAFGSANAQVFDKGDRKVDLTIGVGTIKQDKSKATFDQHLSMEWGIAKVADKFTLGVGFAINNAYGGTYDGMVTGSYDYSYGYSYTAKQYHFASGKWERVNKSEQRKRKGTGYAEAKVSREDLNVMPTFSVHYSPMNRLDTYVKVGVGVGVMMHTFTDIKNEQNFGKADVNDVHESKYLESHTVYSYNDLNHVKWEGYKTRAVPSVAAFVGATYMLTDKWGVDAQVGLISSCLKDSDKGYNSSYSIFAIGASYRF